MLGVRRTEKEAGSLSIRACRLEDRESVLELWRQAEERFAAVAGGVRSRFFTMDVAQRRDGDWLIVELGDGQVAGLPDHADVDGFYKALKVHWPDEPG